MPAFRGSHSEASFDPRLLTLRPSASENYPQPPSLQKPTILRGHPRPHPYPMICPYCDHNDDKVIDSRASDGGRVVRRRRECLKCEKRFTTYEKVEESGRLMVIKRDGTRVPFSRENVLKGVLAACGKRPVAEESKQGLVDLVEEELYREFDREVPSRAIGERVMQKLAVIDKVAYVRFASEYYQFQNVGQFVDELRELDARPRDMRDQAKLF